MTNLPFERSVLDLEGKIAELRHMAVGNVNIAAEVDKMKAKANRLLVGIYANLTPAQKVQVARHQARPHFSDYVRGLITDFTPLAGDRMFGEDSALIGGLGRFRDLSCVILGQERGRDTVGRIKHNFGMARPEGYRKAQRLMDLAQRFALPVITLVDTAGAYPGVGAEERGQAQAIAQSMQVFLRASVPIVSIIIGEGGSGGAIAIAVADRVYMLEHSIYSIISPEGCASILWRSAEQAPEAAEALRLTAQDLLRLGIIDGVIAEPIGGAHRRQDEVIATVGRKIEQAFADLIPWEADSLRARRTEIFLARGNGEIKL